MTMRRVSALMIVSICQPAIAERLDVTIVDVQSHTGTYTYVVPGHSSSTTSSNVDCSAFGAAVSCSGGATSTGFSSPGYVGSYEVQGATLALQLPDGRIAVVNCSGKLNWTDFKQGAVRDCRIPLVREVQADFKGSKAKLRWPVSIDGKKMQDESYDILGIVDKFD